MHRLTRPIVSLVLAVALCAVGPMACLKSSSNQEKGTANPQQATAGGATDQASGDSKGPVPQPAQSTSGQPSVASDNGSSTATQGLPSAQPGAPASDDAAATAQPAKPALTVPAGTLLTIRLSQRVGVTTSKEGDFFTGKTAAPIATDGKVVIPEGASVTGVVLHVRKRGRFKGESVLRLTLSGLNIGDQHYQIRTNSLTASKKGKGRRTAAFIGGGAGLGALIGGVATGGTGLILGSLAGTGAGTVTAALTGNRDIDYPAESVLSFRLNAPLLLQP